MCGLGSSPLTRGKPTNAHGVQSRIGLIPAHAGKTEEKLFSSITGWAHPRSRGENIRAPSRPAHDTGSSPLTRGKPVPRVIVVGLDGLIPAHAGKTIDARPRGPLMRAHPRSRGENSTSDEKPARGMGSSPLTRGKRADPCLAGDRGRLIPAHAGKTLSTGCPRQWTQAHPRSRGENLADERLEFASQGSSPLTRGKQAWRAHRRRSQRLIPAHAGKTLTTSASALTHRAHPRSRGENVLVGRFVQTRAGSSPLTRGKRSRPSCPFAP